MSKPFNKIFAIIFQKLGTSFMPERVLVTRAGRLRTYINRGNYLAGEKYLEVHRFRIRVIERWAQMTGRRISFQSREMNAHDGLFDIYSTDFEIIEPDSEQTDFISNSLLFIKRRGSELWMNRLQPELEVDSLGIDHSPGKLIEAYASVQSVFILYRSY